MPGFTVEPTLPYPDAEAGRSSGWSGSDTSRERAHRDDTNGTTAQRQTDVLRYLAAARFEGVTWREIVEAYPSMHHGSASGVLSNLHKAGKIARVTERRNRCQIYVLPEYVGGRQAVEQGRRGFARVGLDHVADALTAHEPLCRTTTYEVSGVRDPAEECSCGWYAVTDNDTYSNHLLAEIAKGAK